MSNYSQSNNSWRGGNINPTPNSTDPDMSPSSCPTELAMETINPDADSTDASSHSSGTSMSTRRATKNPNLDSKLKQMALPLAPLMQLTTGFVHPAFPKMLLNFWLLTSEQLDELACFYHQREPCQWTRHYPCPISWQENLPLEVKRRKIGKFIGLRGCETPIAVLTEEEIMANARRARMEADDEVMRKKLA